MSANTHQAQQHQPVQQADLDPAATTARLLRCLARYMALAPQSRAWPVDVDGRMTFLRIPVTVNLEKREQQTGLYGGHASIVNLPPEIHCLILSQLEPVDRICLSLTCKSLTSSVLASQLLKVPPWSPWLLSFTIDTIPPQEELILRLAHGWFDKTKHRYCSHCKKILPRDAEYWRNKLNKRKKLPFHLKVRAEKDDWHKLNRKNRYEHIIKDWCQSKQADSSIFSCATCIPQRGRDLDTDIEKGFNRSSNIFDAPVECPCCVEKSITVTYHKPHTPKVRPKLWKYTRWTLGFIGNTFLVLLYLVYLLLKLPFDLGGFLWKTYKRNRASTGRKLLCLV